MTSEQDLGRGGRVDAGQGQDEDQVEVQAAEVGAQPPGPAEPVGVGDVGEERGPHQVDADADPRRAGRRRSGSRRRDRTRGTAAETTVRPNTTSRSDRVAQDLLQPGAQPVRRRTASSRRPRRWRPRPRSTGHRNSGRSSVPAAFGGAFGQQRAPGPEREQRAGLGQGGRGALAGDDAQRQQLGGDEIADLVGGQRPAEVGADQVGDGGRVAGAVDQGGDLVQQRRHLDDLAVGPPHQRRRLAVAGVLVRRRAARPRRPAGAPLWARLSPPGAARGPCARWSCALRSRSRVCSSLACSAGASGMAWARGPARSAR